jgi:hypothetical protein
MTKASSAEAFSYLFEAQQCFADLKEAKRCELGSTMLSMNLYEIEILLSNR